MNVKTMDNISIYNHSYNRVVLSTRDNQYTMEPAVAGVPSSLVLSFKEIEYINGSCGVVRNGTVRFADEIRDEMYEALRVPNWQDILFEEVIEDIITNPSPEKMQRILDVKNIGVIERVKGVLTQLENNPNTEHKVTSKVKDIIHQRFSEISHGRISTNITLTKKNTSPAPVETDVADIKRELEEMKALVAQMIAGKQKEQTAVNEVSPEPNSITPTRKTTRNTKK